MVFNTEQKTFMIQCYYRNGILNDGQWTYPVQACLEQFQQKYPEMVFPAQVFFSTLRRTVQLFQQTGSVTRKKGSGRRTVRDEEAVNNVEAIMENEPTTSLRHLSQQVGLSYGTCQKIMKKDLHCHPYKLQSAHELLPPDYARRVAYCHWFNENIRNDDVLDLTFFSDEAWFHVSGYINAQNFRMWSADNPHFFRETPLHPLKVGVWLAVSRRRIIGPIFFDGNITAQRYRDELLRNFIEQLHDDELQNGFFQHDGATAHTTQETLAYLRQYFDDRVISLHSQPEFPPRSPDLTLLDFFAFPHLKNTIFKTRINTIEELRERIQQECANITPEILRACFENMKRRVNLCLQQGGGHFEHLM